MPEDFKGLCCVFLNLMSRDKSRFLLVSINQVAFLLLFCSKLLYTPWIMSKAVSTFAQVFSTRSRLQQDVTACSRTGPAEFCGWEIRGWWFYLTSHLTFMYRSFSPGSIKWPVSPRDFPEDVWKCKYVSGKCSHFSRRGNRPGCNYSGNCGSGGRISLLVSTELGGLHFIWRGVYEGTRTLSLHWWAQRKLWTCDWDLVTLRPPSPPPSRD